MTKHLIEVPFTLQITGTALVVADDDVKGRERIISDFENVSEIVDDAFDNLDLALKDQLGVIVAVGNGTKCQHPEDYLEMLTDEEQTELSSNKPEAPSGAARPVASTSPQPSTPPAETPFFSPPKK